MLTGTEKSLDARESVKVVLDQLTTISRQAVGLVSTFLLAVLFSFLIVLDMPRLSNSIRDLRNTRLRFVYDEMADNIYEFGKVLGHTMQAQFYIACVNTLLTAIGLLVLGMGEHIAFLSVIVFLFSFIPVAGVFISSIPICLLALNDGGLSLMALSILMIVFIHMVEGYFLNPMIYGARLRINPVIVLIILTVGGKLFHIWGLILGVPVCTYIFGYAIRYEKPKALGTFKR
jgi:predicted PurR-regulated permease PerM